MRWWARLARWRRPDPEVTRARATTEAHLDQARAQRPHVEHLARRMQAHGVDSLAELVDQVLSRTDGYP